ncbi:unnamed protein product, partial [Bubo scandiacus]
MFSVLKGALFSNQNIHTPKCCFQPALLPAAVRIVPWCSVYPLPSHFTGLKQRTKASRCREPAPRDVFLIAELMKLADKPHCKAALPARGAP